MNKVAEIEIKGEGLQLKVLLEDGYSYKELMRRFELKRNSINRYVGGVLITNQKFINQIEELFEKPFNKIIMPVEEQMKAYIYDIKNNIKHYNKPTDNKPINDHYDHALIYNKPYEQLIAKGNLALYQYNMGLHYDAENLLREVVEVSTEMDFHELVVYYTVQLAFVQLGYDIKLSKKTLFKAEGIIKDKEKVVGISKETIFNYYHFYGVTLRRLNNHKDAREIFKKALEWATDDSKLTKALSNIGNTYYEEGKYKSAIEWAGKALDQSPPDRDLKGGILNNIANYYHRKGEIGKAHYYLKMAMDSLEDDLYPGRKIIAYDTFLELNAKDGTRLLSVIIDVFENVTPVWEYFDHLINCVEKLYCQLKKIEDTESLSRLYDALMIYTKIEGEKRSLKDLKAIVLDMTHYLLDKGVLVIDNLYNAKKN